MNLDAYRTIMFSDTESCPHIFSNWRSHEDSCASAYHNCITCYYCMANINYWGAVDKILQLVEPPTTQFGGERESLKKRHTHEPSF
jgi:hypothetical protein